MANPNGLTGLQGLAQLQGFVNPDPEATAEEIHGGTADPKHGAWGEEAEPYPWVAYGGAWGEDTYGPQGPDDGLVGESPEARTLAAGNQSQDPTGDATPYTHAGPFPRGRETSVGPDATSRQLEQSRILHSIDTGAADAHTYMPTMVPKNDDWVGFYNPETGESMLVPIPDQLKGAVGGWGQRDVTQSFARQNGYNFNTAHRHRRYANGVVPGNSLWMTPRGRPMIRSLPGPARPPVGVNSPFAGQDIGQAFGIQGAILMDPATEYVAPPTPYVAPATQSDDTMPEVDWF
jgi:hypothetical protein